MKTKLTLSLPEPTIRTAKQLAKARHTTVSSLFATSIEQWVASTPSESLESTNASPQLNGLLGAFGEKKAFDAKSAHIRSKHG